MVYANVTTYMLLLERLLLVELAKALLAPVDADKPSVKRGHPWSGTGESITVVHGSTLSDNAAMKFGTAVSAPRLGHLRVKRTLVRSISAGIFAAVLGLGSTASRADVTILVAYRVGGYLDVVASILKPDLAELLRENVVTRELPNRPEFLHAALAERPEASAFLLADVVFDGELKQVTAKGLLEGFATVAVVGERPLVLIAGSRTNISSLGEFRERLRQGLDLFHVEDNLMSNICARALFKQLNASDKDQPAPYSSVLGAVAAQRSAAACVEMNREIDQGSYVVLGTTRESSLRRLKTVRTLSSQNIDITTFNAVGIFAPAGTPAATIDRLSRALEGVLQRPAVIRRLAEEAYLATR